jgi:anti-anti-sigma regulatory factor
MATVPELSERLEALPDCDIVLELSTVSFLSAAGVRVLLDLRSRLAQTGALSGSRTRSSCLTSGSGR